MPKLKTNIEKLFYPIGEVAQMYGVNVSLIRFWENELDERARCRRSRTRPEVTFRTI